MAAPVLTLAPTILLIGAAQSLFFSIALLGKRDGHHIANRLLSVLTLAIALTLIDGFLEISGYFRELPFAIALAWPLNLLFGPLIFWYAEVISMSQPWRFTRRHGLQMLPFMIGVVLLIPFYSLDSTTKIAVIYEFETLERPLPLFALLCAAFIGLCSLAHLGIYVVLTLRLLRRHRRRIQENFSFRESINLDWLRWLSISFALLWAFFLFTELFSSSFELYDETYYTLHVLLVVVIYLLGYYGMRQPAIFDRLTVPAIQQEKNTLCKPVDSASRQPITEGLNELPKYRKSTLKSETADVALKRLMHFMEEAKPYLDCTLTLPQLAEQLQLSTHHLSQIINQRLEENYFDFVNRHRVEEAKRLLSDTRRQHATVLEIAFDVGFNSKSAFYSAFKKHAGITPLEFRKAQPSNLNRN